MLKRADQLIDYKTRSAFLFLKMGETLTKDNISRLRADTVIHAVYSSIRGFDIDAYLVGGVLRNITAGFPIGCDYDFALTTRVKDAADRFADIIKGSPFLLDKETGSFRIVARKDKKNINVDISPVKGRCITEDILARDFTINAMAVDLRQLFEKAKPHLIDPLSGREHCKKKTIVHVRDDIFENDPIRLLRAIRLSARYGFSIRKDTQALINAKAGLLSKSSWERIRDEFFLTMELRGAEYNLKRFYELGLLHEITPEIRDWDNITGYDLLSHAFQAVRSGERFVYSLKRFMPEYEKKLSSHFNSVVGNIPRFAIFKFAVFLHDAGKPAAVKADAERLKFTAHEVEGEGIAKRIVKRLKLSRRAVNIICRLVRNHHRVFNLAHLKNVSFRSKAHFFRVMGGEGIDLLLLSLADARAVSGSDDPALKMLVKELIAFYYDVYSVKKPLPILNGDEVMKIFNLPEGIMVGRILRKIQDGEAEGLINNKDEAVKYIKKWLAKSGSQYFQEK